MHYTRANTDWMASSFGLSVHWTAQSKPLHGSPVLFQQAVDQFNLPCFMQQLRQTQAGHLIFVTTHATQHFPGHCPTIEKILPGRTARRDLLGELSEALHREGIRLIVYYNHSCNQQEDVPWEETVGYRPPRLADFARNYAAIVQDISQRLGDKISGWWFDSCYSLDPRGPHNSISTELSGWQCPWESITAAAKTGNPNAAVAFNAGVDEHFRYTDHQDYWAGETTHINTFPSTRFTPDGLQFHQWTCLDSRDWVHAKADTPFANPLYAAENLAAWIAAHKKAKAAATLNVEIDQTGLMNPAAIELIAKTQGP